MNIVVNGASGYIGYHLVNRLLCSGHKVFAVCRNRKGLLENISESEKLKIIISSQNELINKLLHENIDLWYQLVWEGSLGEKRSVPEIQIQNVNLSVEAMEIVKEIGCKKIIYTGTVYEKVFDCIIDSSNFDKNSFYILAKKHAHEMTLQLSKKLGIDYIWCQFCHPIGKYMNENQLVPYALKRFLNNEPASFGGCTQYFDIIPIEYLVDSLIIIGETNCKKNNYYIGSGMPKKLKEYIVRISQLCEYNREIGFGERADDGMVFKKSYFDSLDFISEFKMNSCLTFDEAICRMINNL